MDEISKALEAAMRKVFAEWFRPVQHADVVLQLPPEWASARTIRALTGVNRDHLDKMVAERQVIAKSVGKLVIYRYSDVLNTINKLPSRG